MKQTRWPIAAGFLVLALTAGCMEPGDRGLRSSCAWLLDAAEKDLQRAKANTIGSVIDVTKAAALIGAARTQQQFNEFQNCVIKARKAREILSVRN